MNDYVTNLGTVCQYVGRTTSGFDPDTLYRYAAVSSIDTDLKRITRPRDVTSRELERAGARLARTGDVLVALRHPERNAVALVPPELDGLQVATDISVLRADGNVLDPSYLFYFVMSPHFVAYLMAHVVGTNFPRVQGSAVRQAIISLPDVQEQRRVANTLDRARALLELHWDAAGLWRRLLPAALTKEVGRAHDHREPESVRPLRELVTVRQGVKPTETGSGRGDLPLIRPGDLRSPLISHAREFVDRTDGTDNALIVVPAHTILVVRRAPSLAQEVPMALATRDVALGTGLVGLVPRDNPALPLYLYAWLLATPYALSGCVVQTSAMDHLDPERLGNVEVPLPSREEMARWATLSQHLLSLAHSLARRDAPLTTLMRSLLERTFPSDARAARRNRG